MSMYDKLINFLGIKTEYSPPPGMKFWEENCFLNAWELLEGRPPTWDCSPVFVPEDFEPISVEVTFNFPEWTPIYFLMLFSVSFMGVMIVELLHNKFDWFVTPLLNKVSRRYHMITERKRFETMNGHP